MVAMSHILQKVDSNACWSLKGVGICLLGTCYPFTKPGGSLISSILTEKENHKRVITYLHTGWLGRSLALEKVLRTTKFCANLNKESSVDICRGEGDLVVSVSKSKMLLLSYFAA